MNDHLRGLAWGSFIGDALATPVHWYYGIYCTARLRTQIDSLLAIRQPAPHTTKPALSES